VDTQTSVFYVSEQVISAKKQKQWIGVPELEMMAIETCCNQTQEQEQMF